MIDRIDHLVLTVRSTVATLDFLEHALGLRRKIAPERPVALKFGHPMRTWSRPAATKNGGPDIGTAGPQAEFTHRSGKLRRARSGIDQTKSP